MAGWFGLGSVIEQPVWLIGMVLVVLVYVCIVLAGRTWLTGYF